MKSTARQPAGAVDCANCGARVDGQYCGACGQSRRDLDRSIVSFARELLDELFRVEGRAYRTARLLATRPGEVAAEYLAGRRVRYTPPFRLYLIASATFFIGYRLTRPVDQAYFGTEAGDAGAYVDIMANVLIVLLPILALALALLYLPARRPLVHHLVFCLYTGGAALLWTLLLILAATALKAGWGHHSGAPGWLPDPYFLWLYGAGMLAFLGYVTVALRRTYGSGWPGATARALVLVVGAAAGFTGLVLAYGVVR